MDDQFEFDENGTSEERIALLDAQNKKLGQQLQIICDYMAGAANTNKSTIDGIDQLLHQNRKNTDLQLLDSDITTNRSKMNQQKDCKLSKLFLDFSLLL